MRVKMLQEVRVKVLDRRMDPYVTRVYRGVGGRAERRAKKNPLKARLLRMQRSQHHFATPYLTLFATNFI